MLRTDNLDIKRVSFTLGVSFLISILLFVPFLLLTELHKPYSFVLYDKQGILLGATVSDDGQWRFPPDDVTNQFEKAIITFEDKRFYSHFGVDPLAVVRAFFSNIKEGRIVSGASTLTMQTVRLLQNNPPRTVKQKIKEAFLAFLFEIRYSKKQILSLYAANAPFGGNVVGLEAASWRYFNRPPSNLSWAESAMLAVLPNRPSAVHPGSNRDELLEKRDELLRSMKEEGIISEETLSLSLLETIPPEPFALPQLAPHYLQRMRLSAQTNGENENYRHISTLDYTLQKNASDIIERWSERFALNGINNAAVLIIDTKTNMPIAYCANTGIGRDRNKSTNNVDMITSLRSSGSLLKPFLYAALLDNSLITRDQLILDIPTRIGSYIPENNNRDYSGATKASDALTQSLNIPAVLELRDFGIQAFLGYLENCGFTTFTRSSDEYGLPLILGGGELTMEEVTKAYAGMMRVASGLKSESLDSILPYSVGSAWITLDTLVKGIRPDGEALWSQYASARNIAWKTGTSHGNRDAWAIGTTPDYTIGVWFGNAEGFGVPELKSISTAAPALFDFFTLLPETNWPQEPYGDLDYIVVCEKSGYIAGPHCDFTEESILPIDTPLTSICPYCISVTLTPDEKHRVTIEGMKKDWSGFLPVQKNFFVLPPHVEFWYARSNVLYEQLPNWLPGYAGEQSKDDLSIVFPDHNAKVFLPIELDGSLGGMVLEAAHRNIDARIYWDIDGEYLGETTGTHKISVRPSYGMHTLTITDSFGNRKVRQFEVLSEH